jgi:hypothetical protein
MNGVAPVMMSMLMETRVNGVTVNWRASGHLWRLEVWMHDTSSLWSRAEGKD